MAQINEHYLKLQAGYLFPEIGRRVKAFSERNKGAPLIRLGIGDVTRPLPTHITERMREAIRDMEQTETFHGYGPEQGYLFLREAIREKEYRVRGVDISADEIFVSDGSKCDSGNIQEIFSNTAKIAVTDPVYPVYIDTNVMAGRSGSMEKDGHYAGIVYLPSTRDNDFSPPYPDQPVDLIYLCSPNNPTGTVFTKEQLEGWVAWAKNNGAIILYDAAYVSFIKDPSIPHSIFEIEGSQEVAIEFRSFSKNAGFTGVRCAYTVVPKKLTAHTTTGESVPVHTLWLRRQCTKFNGVSYIVQKGALAALEDVGQQQIQENIDTYMKNARTIRDTLVGHGIQTFGGEHAPYIWFQIPGSFNSWEYFDHLLETIQVVGTPGSGFGPAGEGYFRLSAFGSKQNVEEAMSRFSAKFA